MLVKSRGKNLGHMEDSRQQKRQRDGVKQADRAAAAGGGGGQGVWDGLINRVSDSTRFCPWDESSRAHRRSTALGNCG